MAPFWEAKTFSRKAFGTPGADLGGIWDHFSPPWIYLDICWSPLGPVWALLGIHFGPSGPPDLLQEVILRPPPAILGGIPSHFYCLSTSWSQFGCCAPLPSDPFQDSILRSPKQSGEEFLPIPLCCVSVLPTVLVEKQGITSAGPPSSDPPLLLGRRSSRSVFNS